MSALNPGPRATRRAVRPRDLGPHPEVWNHKPFPDRTPGTAPWVCADCGVDCRVAQDALTPLHGPNVHDYCASCCPRHPEWECWPCGRERPDPFRRQMLLAIARVESAEHPSEETP